MSDDLESRRLARDAGKPDPPKRRATQAELNAAATKYSTVAGSKQADLVTPLTAAELAHPSGGGYEVGITSVDMTPRPRYRESQARFEARMRGYGLDVATLRREVALENRKDALRSIELPNGGVAYWTQCACGWCGLRLADPELARREYDAHPCAAEGVGQAAVDRAQAAANNPHREQAKPVSVLKPSLPSRDAFHEAMREVDRAADRALEELRNAPTKYRGHDDAAERFALLEGIPK